ncbi:MAG: hypothetical protein ACR2J5_17420 [Geodermatophilaceae bacterium]
MTTRVSLTATARTIRLTWSATSATATRVGIDDQVATDPRLMLDALLSTLHALLSPNAAYLDTRLAS